VAEKGHCWQTEMSCKTSNRKPTMMNIRVRMSAETVKKMTQALQKAYKSGDAKMIRRIMALLDFSRGDSPAEIATQHGVSVSSVYEWLKQLLTSGMESLKPKWKGGRKSKLSQTQKNRLCALIKAGPQAAGYPQGCWSGLLVQDVIWREFGVLFNAHYVCELLKTLGFSYQKARFVSDHLDEAKRLVWMKQTFPDFKRQAQAAGGLLLFGDEGCTNKSSGTIRKPFRLLSQIMPMTGKESSTGFGNETSTG
jgi:transposase